MNNKEYRTNEIISQYCLSRMLVGKSIENDFCTQSLVITIQVNTKKNSETLKLTLYKRLYKLLYGSAEDKRFANFSLLIAGDVEGTREGYGVCQTSCPPISCSVSDFRGADFGFWIEPDGSGGLPVAGFA
jgi:hypothetical protein